MDDILYDAIPFQSGINFRLTALIKFGVGPKLDNSFLVEKLQ